MPTGVERWGERHERPCPNHRRHRRCWIVRERSEHSRRLGEGGCQQQVPSVGPPLLQRAAELDVGRESQRVVDTADALGEGDLGTVDGLDVVVVRRSAELRFDPLHGDAHVGAPQRREAPPELTVRQGGRVTVLDMMTERFKQRGC